MTTAATRNRQDNTPEATLFVAFELSEKPGSSALPVVRKNSNLGTGATSFYLAVSIQLNGMCRLA